MFILTRVRDNAVHCKFVDRFANSTNSLGIVDEINELYGTDQFKINYWIDDDGKCWLNLDWFGSPQHPGGQYFDYKKRTIYYPTIVNPTYEQESKE